MKYLSEMVIENILLENFDLYVQDIDGNVLDKNIEMKYLSLLKRNVNKLIKFSYEISVKEGAIKNINILYFKQNIKEIILNVEKLNRPDNLMDDELSVQIIFKNNYFVELTLDKNFNPIRDKKYYKLGNL